MENPLDPLQNLREKYLFLSRYLNIPMPMGLIKFFNWISLSFSAFGSAFFIHWGLTSPLMFSNADIQKSQWALEIWGFIIIWPLFIIAFFVGFAFSVCMYASSYDSTSEKVHDMAERKSKKWYQSILFFETSLDILYIRLTGVAGMVMLSYGAVNNFNNQLAKEAEIKSAQRNDLIKYQETTPIIENIKYWTDRKINGKGDDDAAADSMIAYYMIQLLIYNQRADSLNRIVYNKADMQNPVQPIDVTASIKFVTKGDEWASGLILLSLLAIIALAVDGSAVRLTRIESRWAQANLAQIDYRKEKAIYENTISGNSSGNSSGNWPEIGNGVKKDKVFKVGKEELETPLAKAIIYARAKTPNVSNREISRALQCSHTYVNDVLKAWREINNKEEAA